MSKPIKAFIGSGTGVFVNYGLLEVDITKPHRGCRKIPFRGRKLWAAIDVSDSEALVEQAAKYIQKNVTYQTSYEYARAALESLNIIKKRRTRT